MLIHVSKEKKREMNLLILELIECSSGHLHAAPSLGPNSEFALLFLEKHFGFFPLCTIVPVVSTGAVVQTFQKQQGQLGKSEERRAKS